MYEICEFCENGKIIDDDGMEQDCPACGGDGRLEFDDDVIDEDMFDEDILIEEDEDLDEGN